jgi:translation elongation factor EF-Ts
MPGRIEVYTHSDNSTENKGALMVKVTTATDFAARTDIFKAFARKAAMLAYGALPMRNYMAASDVWSMVTCKFPELEAERQQVERELHEPVTVTHMALLRL